MSHSELLDQLNAEHKRIHSGFWTSKTESGGLVTRRIKEPAGAHRPPPKPKPLTMEDDWLPPWPWATERPRMRPRVEHIQRLVASCFNISRADIISARRTAAVVRPRQIAMYLSKLLTPHSLPEIGRRFGGRDHTTVLHAVRKIEDLLNGSYKSKYAQQLKIDATLSEGIELLKRMLVE